MPPRARDFSAVARRVEAALADGARAGGAGPGETGAGGVVASGAGAGGAGADETGAGGVVATLIRTVSDLLGITGSCWHLTDPTAGLPTASAGLGEPAGTLEWSLEYEFRRPDLNRFDELRRRRSAVAAISLATGGRPEASARFREMIAPTGSRDELRVAFVDPFGIWATAALFTDRRMTEEDLAFLAGLVPVGTRALRASAAAAAREPAPPTATEPDEGPAVLVLDAEDRIISADVAARRRLALLPEPRPVAVPGVVAFASAQVRWGAAGRAATARMRASDGRWLTLDASRLDADGSVAVVIQPAPPLGVLDAALRAFGLSAREREVAALLHRGHSTKSIAAALVVSPYTVQDHVKAVYAKTGVGGRGELLSLLPAAAAR